MPTRRTHWFYSHRSGAFYPDSLRGQHSPTKVLAFQPGAQERRHCLVGGQDGFIRNYDPDVAVDDGAPFDSYVVLPPVRLGVDDRREGQILELIGTLAHDSGPVQWALLVGDSMEQLEENPRINYSGEWTAGRNPTVRPRSRGGAAAVRLAGMGYAWGMETVTMLIKRTGRQRL